MNDAVLSRLLRTLDTAVEASPSAEARVDLHGDLELAALRLKCLSQRLGVAAEESPYLAFLRRTLAHHRPAADGAGARMAASA